MSDKVSEHDQGFEAPDNCICDTDDVRPEAHAPFCPAALPSEPAANPEPPNEVIQTLKEVRQFISGLSSSAMLAGEEFPEADRGTFYSESCKAGNSLDWAIEELGEVEEPSGQDWIRNAAKEIWCLQAGIAEPHLYQPDTLDEIEIAKFVEIMRKHRRGK